MGTRYDDIATKLGISDDTLKKYYQLELDLGRVEANAKVANALFQQAMDGNTTAQIFWLKTRAGWKENHTIEHVGDSFIKVITGIEEQPKAKLSVIK
jgi:hypothetical protein